jgi:hypothetical protein
MRVIQEPHGELFNVHKSVILRDKLAMAQQAHHMLLNRLAAIPACLFNGLAIRKQPGTAGL